MNKLETRGLCKSYDGREIIKEINLHIKEGEIVSLLGVSGVGKTTLFNLLSGLEKPDAGDVLLNGEIITETTGHVSYMQQKDLMMPYKTILDNVALPLILKGKRKKEARREAQAYFETFGLSGTQKQYPCQISGGMKQRASFLRAYLFSRELMLLDEPFSALDTITKSAMHHWYLEMMDKVKISTVFITHDIDEAIYLSDRIYILSGKPGQISEEIKIPAQRPRNEDFGVSDTFISYKRHIIEHIKKTSTL